MMDLIATTNRAPQAGETVKGTKFHTAPGGKGANQAVQCARLGARVTMVGCVGDDAFGSCMREAVAAAGVDVSHVKVDKTEASGVGHILVEQTPERVQNRITICPGANLSLTVEDIRWLQKGISQFDLVMLQFELPMEVDLAVARWAKDAGVRVMVNPAPAAPIPPELCACATYLSPNETEAALLSGCAIRTEREYCAGDVEAAAGRLCAQGVENLIITLGDKGAALVEAASGRMYHVDCVRAPGGGPHGGGRFLRGRLLRGGLRRADPPGGGQAGQLYRRADRLPDGGDPQPPHDRRRGRVHARPGSGGGAA